MYILKPMLPIPRLFSYNLSVPSLFIPFLIDFENEIIKKGYRVRDPIALLEQHKKAQHNINISSSFPIQTILSVPKFHRLHFTEEVSGLYRRSGIESYAFAPCPKDYYSSYPCMILAQQRNKYKYSHGIVSILMRKIFFCQKIRQHIRCRCRDFDAMLAIFRRTKA